MVSGIYYLKRIILIPLEHMTGCGPAVIFACDKYLKPFALTNEDILRQRKNSFHFPGVEIMLGKDAPIH